MYFVLVELTLKANRQLFISNVKAIIYQVTDRLTVNCANKITGLQTRAVCGTFWHYLTHPTIHFWH
jgi:hypothetical protein